MTQTDIDIGRAKVVIASPSERQETRHALRARHRRET